MLNNKSNIKLARVRPEGEGFHFERFSILVSHSTCPAAGSFELAGGHSTNPAASISKVAEGVFPPPKGERACEADVRLRASSNLLAEPHFRIPSSQ